VGYGENSRMPLHSFNSFEGQTVGSQSVLIEFTQGADASLDGLVGNDDLTIVGGEYGNADSGQWYLGDFDYSGLCDNDDVTTASIPAGSPLALKTTSSRQSVTLAAAQVNTISATSTITPISTPAASGPDGSAKVERRSLSKMAAVQSRPALAESGWEVGGLD